MNALTLPPVCDRAAARELLPDLRDGVGDTPLAIDASQVERIGEAMLQVLISASRTEGGITLHTPSTALVETLRLAGLAHILEAEINEEAVA